ncbi:MAG: hypothetical protein AMS24_01700 [Chlamydiae bacterium SM23_39]|nr:MAG: hypothetical protein AMS24_01700 [Chlamydiae bacterium SM23_39]
MLKNKISKIQKSLNKNEKPEEIKDEQKKVKDEQIDYKDKYFRVLAELENMRKRMQKEKQETIKFAIENIICEFLPILDNFENAIKFSQTTSEEIKTWATGFKMIQSQFKDLLHNYGVVSFHSEGNQFDPSFHEAMEILETDEHQDGTILKEFIKGYKNENRTIRPAKVKVAKNKKNLNKEGNNHEKK